MTVDSTNVDVAVTGALSKAPSGTAAPTNATSALPVDWLDHGYLSEDGVTENRERDSKEIPAWQNGDIVRVVYTKGKFTLNCTMIETSTVTQETFYGSEVAVDGSIEINPIETGGRHAWVLDYIDGDKYVRLYIPDGEVTEVGEVTIAGTDAVGYEITVMAYRDPTLGYSSKKWLSALAA